MVERRITDGRRIAQLLASEIEGHEDGPLGPLSVARADREAAVGDRAYDVVAEAVLARVFVEADRARIECPPDGPIAAAIEEGAIETGRGLAIETEAEGDELVLAVERASAVKRASRAIVAGV